MRDLGYSHKESIAQGTRTWTCLSSCPKAVAVAVAVAAAALIPVLGCQSILNLSDLEDPGPKTSHNF